MKNKEIMIRCQDSWFSDDYTMFVWLCRRSADSIKAETRTALLTWALRWSRATPLID